MPIVIPSLGTPTPPLSAYATLVDFNNYLPGSTSNPTHATLCLATASRWIEKHCNRKFSLDTNATARTFEPQSLYHLDLRSIPYADIGSTSGFTIKSDAGGDGAFETTWLTTDYELTPYNAAVDGPEPRPWTGIRAVGAQTFPLLVAAVLTRFDKVQVTAKWGWPAVPSAVQHACLMQAARLFSRTKSPDGVAGFGDSVALRVSNQIDPDVAAMLHDYRRQAVLVR